MIDVVHPTTAQCRDMRVQVFNADNGGCGFYRALEPVKALAAEGYDVICRGDEDQLEGLWKHDGQNKTLVALARIEADVIVFQRAMHRHHLAAIPLIQQQGVAVVIELDDDFDNVHPQNLAWRSTQPAHSPDSNVRLLRQIVAMADLVTVSTPALGRKYPGSVVLPNYLPRRVLDLPPHEPWGCLRVGWSGDIGTHPTDLKVTGGSVGQACRKALARLHVIGNGRGISRDLGIEPSSTTGWIPIDEYHYEMGGMDVGIVPLQLTAFNEAKSWLKGLELSARGVPFVASPTEQYRELAAAGAGRLAAERSGWRTALRDLLMNANLRLEEGARAKGTAARFVLEDHAERWWEAWRLAADRRAAKAPVA